MPLKVPPARAHGAFEELVNEFGSAAAIPKDELKAWVEEHFAEAGR